MSQMQKFDDISMQIASIENSQKEMAASKVELRKFVVPDREEKDKSKMPLSRFLDDYDIFNQLLSKWADTLMTLVEATGKRFDFETGQPIGFGGGMGQSNGEGFGGQPSDLTKEKMAVLIAAIIGSVLISWLMKAPWTVPALLVGATVFLTFGGERLANAIQDWMKKPEKIRDGTNSLGDDISDSLIYIRARYNKKRFQIKHQYSNPKMLANHDPQEDPALWDRRTQALETLPLEIMGRIDAISVKCNAAAFERKRVLYGFWRESGGSGQPQPQQTAPMGINR